MSLKDYLYLSAVVVLLICFGVYTYHEREVGEETLQHSIDQASLKAQAAAEVETDKMKSRAEQAEADAESANAKLQAYLGANPIGPVRVCVPVGGVGTGVPKAAASSGPPAGAGPGPVASQPVSPGGLSQGSDISPELDTIVQSFGQLAISDAEFQQR